MGRKKRTDKLKENQATQLKKILKDLHLSQTDIVNVLKFHDIKIDESKMSGYMHGNYPLSNGILNGLHQYFFINPEFLSGDSDYMYDIPETILNYAFQFAQKITVTENPNRKIKLQKNGPAIGVERYLHITMDKKYYEYLIYLDSLEEKFGKSIYDKKEVISGIKDLYKNGEHEMKEYVLLPRNTFLNILRTEPEKEVFQELIDTGKLHNYPECKEIFKTK